MRQHTSLLQYSNCRACEVLSATMESMGLQLYGVSSADTIAASGKRSANCTIGRVALEPTKVVFKSKIREVKICAKKFAQAYYEFGPKKPSSAQI